MLSCCIECRLSICNKLLLSCTCKRSVVRKRAPSFVSGPDLYAFICVKTAESCKQFHASEYGNRIIQRAERVHAYIKSEVLQLFSDVVGKAAAKHHYLVFI